MQPRGLISAVGTSVVLCVVLTQRTGAAQSGAVAFSYQMPEAITLHEPVVTTVTIENRSSRPVTVDLGDHHVGQFEFTLAPPGGRTVSVRPGAREGLSSGPDMSLGAGERQSESFVLNRWLRFGEPGTYEVRIKFLGTATTPVTDDSRLFVTRLTVLPRDVAQLKRKCEALATVLLQGSRAADRLFALEQLEFVDDPVAIPYLRTAADAGWAYNATKGLERMGGAEAREALQAMAVSPNPDVALFAKEALKRIK